MHCLSSGNLSHRVIHASDFENTRDRKQRIHDGGNIFVQQKQEVIQIPATTSTGDDLGNRTCSASSRCFEARGCESTLPCDAEVLRLHHRPWIEHFRTFSGHFCLNSDPQCEKHDLRLMKTDISFFYKETSKKDVLSQHVFKADSELRFGF